MRLIVFLICLSGPAETLQNSPLLRDGSDRSLVLGDGVWHLGDTLVLTAEHSGMTIAAAPGAKPVISGGVAIVDWQRDGELWVSKTTLKDVRQLYHGLTRLPRARIPNTGWLRADKLSTITDNIDRSDDTRPLISAWRKDRPELFLGMRYREADADVLRDVTGGMVQTISAWESAWQALRSIDHSTRDIQLFTPSRYPLVHWDYGVNEGGGTPYAIENSRSGLDLPGEWCFDAGRIYLKLAPDEQPHDIIAASLETLLRVDGASKVNFRGITFAHATDRLGRYEHHTDWPSAIRRADPSFPESFPPGITVAQSAPGTGDAIVLTKCSAITFEDCEVRNTGGYGMWIGDATADCALLRCRFTDLGSGGINIHPGKPGTASGHRIEDCRITHGGIVHPAAVGIRIAEASDNLLLHNEVAHFGYSGISIGWAWNPRPNHTTGNRVIANDLHHLVSVLSDGSGIYTLGSIPGTELSENYVHDILRAATAIGAGNSGIFFDQYSKGAQVRRNVVRRVASWKAIDERQPHPVKHHRNLPDDHVFADNDVAADDAPIRLTEVAARAGPRPRD
jgi:hypothetical protein